MMVMMMIIIIKYDVGNEKMFVIKCERSIQAER